MTEASAAGDDSKNNNTDAKPLDQAAAEKAIAEAKRRKKRLSLEPITLPPTTRHYSLGALLVEPLRVVFRGDGITSHGGDFDKVMHLTTQLYDLAVSLGSNLELVQIFFGNSVTVEFKPIVSDEIRAEAQELVDQDPNGEITEDEVERLIPPSVVGAAVTARLLNAPVEVAVEEASRYGAPVRDAYVELLEAVADSDGGLELEAPGDRRAVVTTGDAEAVLSTIEPGAGERRLRPHLLEVIGTLSMIEVGDENRDPAFRLRLDPDRRPDVFAGNRRYVEGRYTSSALQDVNQNGLVEEAVRATVRAWPVKVPNRKRLRFERFVFEKLEPYDG